MDRPDGIGQAGHVRDLVARKSGATRIIEVEMPASLVMERDQHETLRRSVGQRNRTTLQIEVVE